MPQLNSKAVPVSQKDIRHEGDATERAFAGVLDARSLQYWCELPTPNVGGQKNSQPDFWILLGKQLVVAEAVEPVLTWNPDDSTVDVFGRLAKGLSEKSKKRPTLDLPYAVVIGLRTRSEDADSGDFTPVKERPQWRSGVHVLNVALSRIRPEEEEQIDAIIEVQKVGILTDQDSYTQHENILRILGEESDEAERIVVLLLNDTFPANTLATGPYDEVYTLNARKEPVLLFSGASVKDLISK